MTLAARLSGITSSGKRVQRYKTAGPGTLRVFDFKNPLTYEPAVIPASAIPSAAKLYDLPDASVAAPLLANAAAMNGASIQSAGGGIVTGTGPTRTITLPADFKLPVLTGLDGRYLIVFSIKPSTAAAPGAPNLVAGWATNTSSAANWAVYQNSGNANYFVGVGSGFGSFGALSAVYHRLALEIIKLAAGTVQINTYIDGVLNSTGTPAAQASIPQPASGNPNLGAIGFGTPVAAEFGSAEIRNLALDTQTAAEIVAADYAAWASRFT